MSFYDNFDDYSANVIDSLKSVLYVRHNDIFDRLDFYDDTIFLEPLLFTYINQPNDEWLDSIIYGYEIVKKEEIKVYSNSNGVVYLPKIGYFITDKFNCIISLKYVGNTYQLKFNKEEISYRFEPPFYLSFGIELLKYQHPLLERFFHYNECNSLNILNELNSSNISRINDALFILKTCNREHFQLLQRNLKRIMLFTAIEPNSFATMDAHNMIFLNVNPWDDTLFYVDHLSHEGAHVTFNTITFESKMRLFKGSLNANFSHITGDHSEYSSLYLRFHGLFTFCEITKSLLTYLLNGNISESQAHEGIGRFAFQLQRFKNSLHSFDNLDVFEEEGDEWFTFFKQEYIKLEEAYGHIIKRYNLLMPSYDFNYEVFKEKNPIDYNLIKFPLI